MTTMIVAVSFFGLLLQPEQTLCQGLLGGLNAAGAGGGERFSLDIGSLISGFQDMFANAKKPGGLMADGGALAGGLQQGNFLDPDRLGVLISQILGNKPRPKPDPEDRPMPPSFLSVDAERRVEPQADRDQDEWFSVDRKGGEFFVVDGDVDVDSEEVPRSRASGGVRSGEESDESISRRGQAQPRIASSREGRGGRRGVGLDRWRRRKTGPAPKPVSQSRRARARLQGGRRKTAGGRRRGGPKRKRKAKVGGGRRSGKKRRGASQRKRKTTRAPKTTTTPKPAGKDDLKSLMEEYDVDGDDLFY